jgi:hypothetical protein
MTLVPMQYALAQEPKIINLSCDGTEHFIDGMRADAPDESVNNAGIVINLANATVSSGFFDLVAHVTKADDTHVEFTGKRPFFDGSLSVDGDIDRVTGAARILTSQQGPKDKIDTGNYALSCKVTNRQF